VTHLIGRWCRSGAEFHAQFLPDQRFLGDGKTVILVIVPAGVVTVMGPLVVPVGTWVALRAEVSELITPEVPLKLTAEVSPSSRGILSLIRIEPQRFTSNPS
jgi:hypothetical protein